MAVASMGLAVHAATLTVFAAASLTDSLTEIASDYQKKTGDKIDFNFGGSGVLARQIQEGASADIFFSADESRMNILEEKGLVEKSTRRNRLSNSLVIIVAADSPLLLHSPGDLTTEKIGHIALAEPYSVAAGIYAREYLEKTRLWKYIKAKVVSLTNVRAALAAVESGDAEAGIVYKTDAAISKKVRIACEVGGQDGPNISYPMAMIKGCSQPAAAEAFLDYLDSDAAGRVFLKFGFLLDKHTP